MQIRHRHVRHTSIQKTEEPVGNLGAENLNFPNGSGLDGDEEDVEARGEFYVDDDADVDMQQHVVTQTKVHTCIHMYIHQHIQIVCIQKHAARHTLPTGCNT